MANVDELYFEPTFKFLICKRHGSGVHPTKQAIKRHLRSEDHRCGGETLKQAISAFSKLSLRSLKETLEATPAVEIQPISPPIRHLKVWNGWNCTACRGYFLSTSLELLQRHAASQHGRRRGEQPLWEACKLQTFFSETRDRRYFQVASVHDFAVEVTGDDHAHGKDECKCHEGIQTCRCDDFENNTLVTRSRPSGSNSSTLSFRSMTDSPTMGTIYFPVVQGFPFQTLKRSSSPVRSLEPHHPLIEYVAKYVRLPVHRIDTLLKSEAFLSAAYPVFDSSHVDSPLNMRAVFPQSQEEPVFINALLYATVQILNRGKTTMEGLSLQEKTLKLLQEKLTSPNQTLSPPVLGAIMILKATAYKTGDRSGHIAHTAGLMNALEISTVNDIALTQAARRATFWLNLSAALVMDCKRAEHIEFPQLAIRQRQNLPDRKMEPPTGFARHKASLPDGLLGCIVDTVELQSFLQLETRSLSSLNTTQDPVDPLQASIQSQLAALAHACVDIGVVAEAVRLGVFMCYYCIWMETWNDSLIQCKLAAKLLDILESTALFGPEYPDSIWLQHMDLLLWLLLIGSSVVELDNGQVENLRQRQNSLIDSVISDFRFLKTNHSLDLKRDLQYGLNDFIYKNGWLQRRWFIKDWFKLEFLINTSDNERTFESSD
ncbi:hypothetical protein GLAREA_10915 [Glarea lozoyensis ATCC 20868]|uniref:Uncharacterized protein n=1 Tax=Glarea lozoyensis (strain ATCC 20868 / MF5171) TaxID=1116229 RepID=S3EA61_GLAL2|nr:uncharacterized protein GLAREA_10915 [Glarea lozoyensis ATCC 20868]EPE35218.1 hypothetical protein GLAREA_10915 [Glarea lozoyensis ATCC 20868]